MQTTRAEARVVQNSEAKTFARDLETFELHFEVDGLLSTLDFDLHLVARLVLPEHLRPRFDVFDFLAVPIDQHVAWQLPKRDKVIMTGLSHCWRNTANWLKT